MKEDIASIVDKGLAYELDGDVFFDVMAFPDYGRLSGRQTQEQEAGARVSVDKRKKNPADFALWKSSKDGEPSWPSPWGPGRPGWHIECSAMSARLLGAKFDIHGGGMDLIFPHHENELAQSAALDRSMANIWVHNGFVNRNNEKMSKSLGNFFTVKEVLKLFRGEILRFFLASKHYRAPIEFSEEGLIETSRALERIYRALAAADQFLIAAAAYDKEPVLDETSAALVERFHEALDDDLNAAKALGYAFELLHRLNANLGAGDKKGVLGTLTAFKAMGAQLGLWQNKPEDFFLRYATQEGIDPNKEKIEELVEARMAARARKDWVEADRLRGVLADYGVVVEDKGERTVWRYAADS
jgi:cysteinyl-tRNA synthetase